MFEYDSMRPCDLSMIEDRQHPVQWHTARASRKLGDSDYVCDLPEELQRQIFEEERGKFEHLRDVFLERRRAGTKILVFKMNNEPSRRDVEALLYALRKLGPASLLWVREAGREAKPCSVKELLPGFYEGRITKFAPYRYADQFLLEEWTALCTKTLELHQEKY